MNPRTALIAGASGLIGSQLLQLLLESNHYEKVISLVRKPSHLKHDRLKEITVNFNKLQNQDWQGFHIDDVFCCLGTTMKKAGSKSAFYQVDYQFVVNLAEFGLQHQANKFSMVTAMNANPNALVYYNQVKGEVETAIEQLKYEVTHIYRPSLLQGDRKESRLGESVSQFFFNVFDSVIPEKYRIIDSAKVACAMLRMATESNRKGVFIHESDQIRNIAECQAAPA